jgi:hypothetical protein
VNSLDPNLQDQANEAALLNVLMYLNVEDVGVKDGDYMSDIIVKLGDIYDAPGGFEAYMANHPSGNETDYLDRQRQYQVLANASSQNEHFSNLMIDNQSLLMDNPPYENGGLNATTFIDQDGNVTFVYRGTGGGEWLDNGTGLGGTVVATEQQRETQEYFDRVIEERLKSINNRISSLDRRMDSLYFKVGLLDMLSLMQADLLTSENKRLARCIEYLEDTADSFERAERNILASI